MRLTNFLDHPALNQLRLSMGADSLGAPPVGWHPRLLDAEEVMRLGQPDPATEVPVGELPAPSAQRIPGPRAVPVRYSRDRESSKILNPIGLPKGAIATDILDADTRPARQGSPARSAPDALSVAPDASPAPALRSAPDAAPAADARSTPAAEQAPATGSDQQARRRRKNQSALEALRRLEGDPQD